MEYDDDNLAGDGAGDRADDAAAPAERLGAHENGDDTVEELAARTAAMQLECAASPPPGSLGLTIQIPNPFDTVGGRDEDVEMPTASPQAETRPTSQRVAAAPALPQPPRFAGRTMQDRRDFMQKYETYLAAVNALQTPYSGAFAMPVAACIESKTKRMIARYEFNTAPNLISEQQWVDYFMLAKVPSLVDYAAVDVAMKKLEMKTTWPEPESRMMKATYPFQILAMDHIPSLPKSYKGHTELLIWVDLFTGYVIAKASASRTAQTIAESYEECVFRRFGASEAIRHDREPGFMSDFFKAFNRILGQRQRATMAYRPQANGTAERMVQTMTRALKMYVADEVQRNWDEYAERLTFAVNTAHDRIRGDTPFFLVHGWDPRTTLEATMPLGSTRRRD
ncbi:hypothetical protein PF004_g30174 [Phytophthora fragariae]|uniref:Integrase catalytic domain-containing protein n=1 Tax=Phytophthora fragariae TaxID=53985 RepID=A0A6G0MDE5_9STRA|nr:hypothetical protein PF004_g30174 [Phytophthora fragariae]